jgi:hypothetical protein
MKITDLRSEKEKSKKTRYFGKMDFDNEIQQARMEFLILPDMGAFSKRESKRLKGK